MQDQEYTFELYEDNAGNHHLFALQDGKPIAGLCDDGDERAILEALLLPGDPHYWPGQYGDDYPNGIASTPDDIEKAYAEITAFVDARNGGAWELDIDEYLKPNNI